jgi:hypothetical protein
MLSKGPKFGDVSLIVAVAVTSSDGVGVVPAPDRAPRRYRMTMAPLETAPMVQPTASSSCPLPSRSATRASAPPNISGLAASKAGELAS